MVPFYSDYLPARPTIDVLDECKLINVRQTPFDNLLNAAVKRGLDIIGSLSWDHSDQPGHAGHGHRRQAVQPRAGHLQAGAHRPEQKALHDVQVPLDAGQCGSRRPAGSTDYDPRKTHFGSFIRKFSLDELPQFFTC